jgi:hypothetical protein
MNLIFNNQIYQFNSKIYQVKVYKRNYFILFKNYYKLILLLKNHYKLIRSFINFYQLNLVAFSWVDNQFFSSF